MAENSKRGWKVRLSLWTLLMVLLLGALQQCAMREQARNNATLHQADKKFTILQVNDAYRIEGIENGQRGGFARLRTIRQDLESQDEVLVLHAGDLLFPSVMSSYSKAQTMVDAMNHLDGNPDAKDSRLVVTFGNHEFDAKRDVFDARVSESDFHWLATNLTYVPGDGTSATPFPSVFSNAHETITMDIAGLRVGIFSLTLDDYAADYIAFDYATDRSFAELGSVKEALKKLKQQKVDVLIALTHQTLEMDEKLACDVPEIDLIVGGHEHVAISTESCGTSITKADADVVTVWVIEVDGSKGGKPKIRKRKLRLDDGVRKDGKMDAFVTEKIAALSRQVPDFFTVYGATVHKLEGLEMDIRGRETALGNWLADVSRERMGTEIAFLNGGGIRINDNIPAGSDIRGEHLAGIFYYPAQLVSFNLTGVELREILNNSVAYADQGSGRFLQVSGIRFKYRKASQAEEGARFKVVDDTIRILDAGDVWRPLVDDRTYSVTTSKYLWSNGYGDGYTLFSQGDKEGGTSPPLTSDPAIKIDLRQVTEGWLKLNKVVRTDIDGRIGRMSPPKGS